MSERALKHVHALKRMVSLGHRGVLIFCAQHCGIHRVSPARSIDPAYARGLEEAIEAGVEVYAAGCVTDLTTDEYRPHDPFFALAIRPHHEVL